jgi:SH3-like domain-containing protein
MFAVSCDGQKKAKRCSIDGAINVVNSLPEVKKQSKFVDSISQNKKHLSFITDSIEIKNHQYYMIKTGFNGQFHWETYTIFYVDKNNCSEILVDEVVSGEIMPINKWRKLKNKQVNKMNSNSFSFSYLFNEGTVVKFTPKDLDNTNPEIQKFKRKLKRYEEEHPLSEDFDKADLTSLINNETFFDLQYYIDSSWLIYFIDKYKIDVTTLNLLMNEAIKQEDYKAVEILIGKGYIISNIELNVVKETQEAKKNNIEENGKEGFEMYLVEKSKIEDISKIIKSQYLNNHIEDLDGYTNLRKEKHTQSEILQKVKTGEKIEVLDNTGDWFLVKTKEGKTGYIHKSRVKSGNNSSHSTTYKLYDRPDFSSFSREVIAKGEIETVHNIEGWDFVKVNGVTGYLPREETKEQQKVANNHKHTFLAEEDEIKPEKKGF